MKIDEPMKIDQLSDLTVRELLRVAEKSLLDKRTQDVKLVEFEMWRREILMGRGTSLTTVGLAGVAIVIATSAFTSPLFFSGTWYGKALALAVGFAVGGAALLVLLRLNRDFLSP